MKIIVIGAGVGGLASAAMLAKDGYNVTVIEKNEQAGGRASLLERDGYKFDMGPSWYLMPEVFERYYQAMGTTTADQITLRHLSPHYRMFFADGSKVDITGDLERDKALFELIEPGSSAAFDRYLAESNRKYDISLQTILYRNINSLRDFMTKDMLDGGRDLNVFELMDRYVKRFFRTEKMQQIIQYTLIFLGGMPQNTPALYSLMSHIDFNLGVWYPEGGIYSVIQSLVRLGEAHGVTYRYNAPITQIETKDGRAVAVHVQGERLEADLILSNADYRHTESLLEAPRERQFSERYWASRSLAPSAFILYLGVKGTLPKLVHHNLLFSKDWNAHFRTLTKKPVWSRDPSLYICNPSKTDPSVAPAGDENLFVLVPIAPGLYETHELREEYADFVLKHVESALEIDLRHRLAVKEIFSISDFSRRYNAVRGTALGLSHTVMQTSIFRPPNRSRRVKNLYFVGANTTPGIGVPMCLISAHLVTEQIRAGINPSDS